MRHNSHIFEPEALQTPSAFSTRWYAPFRPRTSLIIQGLPGSGKSTLANALCGRVSLFPYFTTSSNRQCDQSPKPSVAVSTYGHWTVVADDEAGTQWQCDEPRTSLQYRLFSGPPGACFSRSLSDSMFRSASSGSFLADGCRGVAVQLPTDPVRSFAYQAPPDVHTPWPAMGPTLESLLRSELLDATHAVENDALDSDVAFVHISLNTDASCVADSTTIVECQAPDDRPAMHLTHTVVFVLAEDEAFVPSRREHQFDALDARRAERNAALVANLSAVTTCDGDKCKCCLVVNMGRRVFMEDAENEVETDCVTMPPDTVATNALMREEGSATSSDFVVVDERGTDECNWSTSTTSVPPTDVAPSPRGTGTFTAAEADEARSRLGRKWRIPVSNIFFLSAHHILADRLTAALASTAPGLHPSACSTQLDIREWSRWMRFVNQNAQRGAAEWTARPLRREPSHAPDASRPFIPFTAPSAQDGGPVDPRHSQTAGATQPTADEAFVRERCERTQREMQRLQSKQHDQSLLVRSIVERAQEDQAEAAKRVVARSKPSYMEK